MHGTPVAIRKIKHDIQNISPTQVTVHHIIIDMSIEFVNRNLGLCA